MTRPGIEPRSSDLQVRCPTDCATRPGISNCKYVLLTKNFCYNILVKPIFHSCEWKKKEEAGAPSCTYKDRDSGYRVTSKKSVPKGERLTLERQSSLKVFDMDVHNKMILDIELYSETGVRLKVS